MFKLTDLQSDYIHSMNKLLENHKLLQKWNFTVR